MSIENREGGAGAALRRLRLLGDQADAVRADLSQLRADLAAARAEFSTLRATQVAETAAHLVEAAAHADTVAQSAVSSLDDLNLYSQLDELTGLPTRTLMLDRLVNTIAAAQRRATRFGLVFLDLDGFKQINDTFGHAAGDQVLQIATQRLQSVVRESDSVSRHGGDEFVILFPEITRATDLSPMAQKILAVLAEPMRLSKTVLSLSASIGISVFPEDGADASALLSRADAAMYRSKRRGRGNFEFHAGEQNGTPPLPDPVPALAVTRRADSALTQHELHLRELRNANHELLEAARNDQTMRAYAEQAHQRQIDFVAMASHAMRTPLSVIGLTASTMKRTPGVSTAATKYVETIEQQARHLARLIDDLLDGSMVGGGEFKLLRTQLSFHTVFDAAVEASRPALSAKRQTLHLARPEWPATLSGDSMRITQLFVNLLRNASRRAPEGGDVWFSATVESSEVVFVVADNGANLSDEAVERVFNLYALDSSLTAHDAGLGIGLAVARELARAHGGSLVAKNLAPPQATGFILTLPR